MAHVAEELKILVKAEVDKAKRDLANWRGEVNKSVDKMKDFAKTMIGVGSVTAGIMLVTKAAKDFVVEGVRFTAQIQKQTVAFETLLRSAGKAETLMRDLQRFSAATPFQLQNLTSAAQLLIATGTEASNVTAVLQDLGNAAMGNSATLERLTDAYAKLQAKGKASLEEINRFTEAGVPILDALASRYNLTKEALFAYISAGKLGFQDVNLALQDLTRGEGNFAGMLEKQSQTLEGAMSTLKDNVALLRMSFVQDLVPSITDAIVSMTEWITKIREAKEEASLGNNYQANISEVFSRGFGRLPLSEQKQRLEDSIAGFKPNLQQTTMQFSMFAGTSAALKEREALLAQEIDRVEKAKEMLVEVNRLLGMRGAKGEAIQAITQLIGGREFFLPGERDPAVSSAIGIRSKLIDDLKAAGVMVSINDISSSQEYAEFFSLFRSVFAEAPNAIPTATQANLGTQPLMNLLYGSKGAAGSFLPPIDLGIGIGGPWSQPNTTAGVTMPQISPSGAGEMLSAFGGESFLSEDFVARMNEAVELAKAMDEAFKDLELSLGSAASTGFQDMLTAIGTGMVDAARGAQDFKSAMVRALAEVARAAASYLATMIPIWAVTPGMQWKVPLAVAGIGASYIAAGAVTAAGSAAVSPRAASASVVNHNWTINGDITDADRTARKIAATVRQMSSPV